LSICILIFKKGSLNFLEGEAREFNRMPRIDRIFGGGGVNRMEMEGMW
jgi:hypothetical protein